MKRFYLKERRKVLKRSIEDLSFEIGVSYNYLSNIENGYQGDKASFILMVKIAKAYGLSIDAFYHLESNYQKEKGVLKSND